jgi:hypothetical protein
MNVEETGIFPRRNCSKEGQNPEESVLGCRSDEDGFSEYLNLIGMANSISNNKIVSFGNYITPQNV